MTINLTLEETKEIIRQHIQKIMPEGFEFTVHIFLDENKDITIECEQQM